MIKLRVQVPENRERTAWATLGDGGHALAMDFAVASVSPLIASKLGNADADPLRVGGHPPIGTYRFVATQPIPGEQREEYGAHALCFEPSSGPALEAESFGRLGLLVYGGRRGKDGLLRRTQGGIRLSDILLHRVITAIETQPDLTLELVQSKPRAWWAFWRSQAPDQALSAEPPTLWSAPNDELTLIAALLASAPRRPRSSSNAFDSSDDDRRWRDRERERGSSSSSSESFGGAGGDFGGAGASGRWDAPSGVDQAGRIVAAGAAGAMIAGVAAAASLDEASESSSLTDTSTGTAY